MNDPAAAIGAAGPAPRSKWAVLGVVMLGTFTFTLDGGMLPISFPALVKAFGTDSSTVVWVSTALFLTTVAIILSVAWVADVVGRKRLYVIGFSIYVLALGIAALAPNVIALIAVRVLQGVGGAMVQANGNALITSAFPSAQRGRAIGLNAAAVGLGLGLGPAVGGLLLDALDWRALFWTRVPLGLIGISLAMAFLPGDHQRSQRRLQIDYFGPILLAGTAATGLLALNLAGRGQAGDPLVWALAALSPVILVLLLRAEAKVPRPVIDFEQFKHRVFAASMGSQFFHYAATGVFVFLSAFFLVDGLGLSASRAGPILTVLPVMRVIGGPMSGIFSDKLGTRPLTMGGLAVMGSGLLLLGLLGDQTPIWGIVLFLAMTGLGSAVFEAPNTSAIMGSAARDRLSAASAYVASGRQVSQSVGFTLGGALFALREQVHLDAGTSQSAAVVSAFSEAMLAAAMIAYLGIGVSYLRGRA